MERENDNTVAECWLITDYYYLAKLIRDERFDDERNVEYAYKMLLNLGAYFFSKETREN